MAGEAQPDRIKDSMKILILTVSRGIKLVFEFTEAWMKKERFGSLSVPVQGDTVSSIQYTIDFVFYCVHLYARKNFT